jgi:hypothetical protein
MTPQETVTVLLDEEYGYRTWIWETGMTPSDLEAWWSSKEHLGAYFFTPTGLPGDLKQVDEDLTGLDAKWNAVLDRGPDGSGEITEDEVQKQIAALCRNHPFKLTYTDTGEPAPEKQPDWWTGHIHIEDDSHLKTNDGRIIVHAGYEAAVKERDHGSSASP